MEKAVRYYCEVLGFQCENRFDGWASLRFDRAEIMLSLPNQHLRFDGPCFTGSLYFRSENVDSLWERLREKAEIAYPIENFDYGMREFAIRDLNGYILQFGKEIKASEFVAPFLPASGSRYNRDL